MIPNSSELESDYIPGKGKLVLLGILIFGAVLRFWGTDFGFPGKFRPDEEYIVATAIGFINNHTLSPHIFNYPTLYIYFNAVVFLGFKLIGNACGLFDPGTFSDYLGRTFFAPMHLVARCVTASFGVLGIWAVFYLARRLYSWKEGLMAAFILAANFIHIRDSHFATTDVALAFLCTIAMIPMIQIVRDGRTRHYVMAGIIIGIAVSVKYPAISLGASYGLAHIFRLVRSRTMPWNLRSLGELALGGVIIPVVFLAGSPYVVLDWATFVDYYHIVKNFAVGGLPGLEKEHGFSWIFKFCLWYSMGPCIWGLGLLGSLWFLVKAARREGEGLELLLLAFMAVLSYPYLTARWVPVRYMVPLMPCFAILASRFLLEFSEIILKEKAYKFVSVLLVLACIEPLSRGIALDHLLSQPDSRVLAADWMRDNIPAGAKIGVEGMFYYGKPELPNGMSWYNIDPGGKPIDPNVEWFLTDEHPIWFFSEGAKQRLKAEISRRGALVKEFDPFVDMKSDKLAYDTSDAFFTPLAGFSAVKTPGTLIRIYRLRPEAQKSPDSSGN